MICLPFSSWVPRSPRGQPYTSNMHRQCLLTAEVTLETVLMPAEYLVCLEQVCETILHDAYVRNADITHTFRKLYIYFLKDNIKHFFPQITLKHYPNY